MSNASLDSRIRTSLHKQLWAGALAVGILVGGFGLISANADIAGAVIGQGRVIVAGHAKLIQHRDGGIVSDIRVKDGDRVEANSLLFRFDGTLVRANLAIATNQLNQLRAQEARLLAEQAKADRVVFPKVLDHGDDEQLGLFRKGQQQLFATRQQTLEGRKSQLDEQVEQYHQKIAAFEAQIRAVDESMNLLKKQVDVSQVLHDKGLLIDSKLIEVKREMASLVGSRASLVAEVSEAHQAIIEKTAARVQVEDEFNESVLRELDEKRTDIAKLQEERVAALDKLKRLDIRAPLTGYIHELKVHTLGGVVGPGETMVSIIPADDDLLVEAKVSPKDIDDLHKDQAARVRLTSLDQRVTPELSATLVDISPDLMTDERSGASYYLARLEINDGETEKIGVKRLMPGMPAEVFIQTRMHTILSYLTKPMVNQIQHAMREK